MYDDTNRGTLGRNRNPKSDRSPPYTGKANIDGVEYWVSAWVKDGANNEKFFSLSFTPKDQPAQQPVPGGGPDFDDSIPFGPNK